MSSLAAASQTRETLFCIEFQPKKDGEFLGKDKCCLNFVNLKNVNSELKFENFFTLRNANFYLSNRISYALGLCGPSFTVDTACSSSAYALDCAYKYIMSGACDSAIVGGSQLLLNLSSTVEYSR